MVLRNLLVHDVTIVTPATQTDRYNNAAKDWASATRTTVKGWITRSGSVGIEVLGDREGEVSAWVLFVLPDVVVTGADRVEWSGITFEVDGPPNRAWTPRGEHHVEVSLKLAEG